MVVWFPNVFGKPEEVVRTKLAQLRSVYEENRTEKEYEEILDTTIQNTILFISSIGLLLTMRSMCARE